MNRIVLAIFSVLPVALPAAFAAEDAIPPREIRFAVDFSGSMDGLPLWTAGRAVGRIREHLHPGDVAPIPGLVEHLLTCSCDRGAEGPTDLARTLAEALPGEPPAEGRLRIVCLMTDGNDPDEAGVIAAVRERLGDARLFVLGVGPAPNRRLIEALARVGRGAAVYVPFGATGEETDAALDALSARLAGPFPAESAIEGPDRPAADPPVAFAAGDREESPVRGLRWLRRHQTRDGDWSSDGFRKQCRLNFCDGAGEPGLDPAATGLSLLAFLAAGESHKNGPHRESVKDGLRFLKQSQDEEGRFGGNLNHVLPALAMAEAYAKTRSPLLKHSAARAASLILERPYELAADPDVVLFSVAAVIATRRGGLLPDADLESLRTFAGRHLPPGAAGLLVRLLLGEEPEKGSDLRREIEELSLPEDAMAAAAIDPLEGWVQTLLLRRIGGERWARWRERYGSALLATPAKAGDEEGSSAPAGPAGRRLGRVGTTALRTLALLACAGYPEK